MNILKQGQRIRYVISDLTGYGKIVGIASNSLPIIGISYIIEPDVPINNEVYQYTHFVAFENQLTVN